MNRPWPIYWKRAFRLAELLVAAALLAILVELLLVHLDRPTGGPEVILVQRTRVVETPAPTPVPLPKEIKPMAVAAKPVTPEKRPPVGPAPVVREASGEQIPATTHSSITFVSLLSFHHVRSRFSKTVTAPDQVRTPANSSPKPTPPFAAAGLTQIHLPGTNQTIRLTNAAPGTIDPVATTNNPSGSSTNVTTADNSRVVPVKVTARPLSSPATGSIRLAMP